MVDKVNKINIGARPTIKFTALRQKDVQKKVEVQYAGKPLKLPEKSQHSPISGEEPDSATDMDRDDDFSDEEERSRSQDQNMKGQRSPSVKDAEGKVDKRPQDRGKSEKKNDVVESSLECDEVKHLLENSGTKISEGAGKNVNTQQMDLQSHPQKVQKMTDDGVGQKQAKCDVQTTSRQISEPVDTGSSMDRNSQQDSPSRNSRQKGKDPESKDGQSKNVADVSKSGGPEISAQSKSIPSAPSSFSVADMIGNKDSNKTLPSNPTASKAGSRNSEKTQPPAFSCLSDNVLGNSKREDSLSGDRNMVPPSSQDEGPPPDLSFGSMLSLLGGTESPMMSAWNDVDTGSAGTPQGGASNTSNMTDTRSAPNDPAGMTVPPIFDTVGSQSGGYSSVSGMGISQPNLPAPVPSTPQYPYGGTGGAHYPWASAPPMPSWPQMGSGYNSDVMVAGGYGKESVDQSFRNVAHQSGGSSWMAPHHQGIPGMGGGMMGGPAHHGGMGYPPMAYAPSPWGHHAANPYSQSPYMGQAPMYGSSGYPSWNYPHAFGPAGIPPMSGGGNPYGQDPSQGGNPT